MTPLGGLDDGRSAKLPPLRVLLIDDEADSLLPTLAQNMEGLGFTFDCESTAGNALSAIEHFRPELILLDLHFPGDDRHGGETTGARLLPDIRKRFPATPVVVFTTRLDDADIPLDTFSVSPQGRFAKPKFGLDSSWPTSLASAMRDAVKVSHYAREGSDADLGFHVGKTAKMRELAALVRVAAGNSHNVLIYGETGSGKQLVAHAIHRLSGRKGRFEQLNCSGVDENTLEARLFGHVRGAFTGAVSAGAEGVFELANRGTLFLDEIQRMPMALQDKLMLVIENRKVRRMGSSNDIEVDVRIVAATNHNLSDLVEDGAMREDLAFRFSVLLLTLPPLRHRLEDLDDFYRMFVERAARDAGRPMSLMLRGETLARLRSHRWPGNVRELESTLARAVLTTTSNVLLPEDIQFSTIGRHGKATARTTTDASRLPVPGTPGEKPAVDGTDPESRGAQREELQESAIQALVEQLESLDLKERYPFLVGQHEELRKAVLTRFICRLRHLTDKPIQHKVLASHLDPLVNGDRDLTRIRKFVCTCVKLTDLECNQ